MIIDSIQEDRGLELPEAYLRLMDSLDAGADYCFNEHPDEDAGYEGRCWSFLDEGRLLESIEMKGVDTAPAHKQLALFMTCYQDFSGSGTVDSMSGSIPVARVSDGFVIAEENGDFLYLDPQDGFSVWIFHHDGCDVMKVSNSIGDWLARAKMAQ